MLWKFVFLITLIAKELFAVSAKRRQSQTDTSLRLAQLHHQKKSEWSFTVGREQHVAKQPSTDPHTAAVAAINDIIIRHSDNASNWPYIMHNKWFVVTHIFYVIVNLQIALNFHVNKTSLLRFGLVVTTSAKFVYVEPG